MTTQTLSSSSSLGTLAQPSTGIAPRLASAPRPRTPATRSWLLLAALSLAASTLHAQSLMSGPTGQVIYPAKSQNTQRAERDKFECHEAAKQQSGFDPATLQAMAPRPSGGSTGSAAGSMVAGAAGGAALASLADKDAGKGAAVGALGMGMRQQLRQQKQMAARQQQAQQQQAALAQHRGAYDRGFAACMEARDYVVK